jgi:hypothetical protein
MSASRKLNAVSQVRMTRAERAALDDWRRQQQEIPTRPEAIREAIRRLVAKPAIRQTKENRAKVLSRVLGSADAGTD